MVCEHHLCLENQDQMTAMFALPCYLNHKDKISQWYLGIFYLCSLTQHPP